MTPPVAPAALAAALLAAALAACGEARVDHKDLETKIADHVKAQTNADIADVICPEDVSPKTGTRVRCTATLAGAVTDIDIEFTHEGRFRITQTRLRNP